MDKGESGTASNTKSARRAMEILEFFADHQRPASVMEIASALDYPQSSTTMILKELTRLGFLERSDDRRYSPTLRVMFLGAWLQDRTVSHGSLLWHLQEIRLRLRTTVIIAMQRGIRAHYMLALRRPTSDGSVRVGASRHICHASVGKALLLQKPDEEIAAIVRRANAEEKIPEYVVNVKAFLDEIAECRQRGWCESSGLLAPGILSIGMPLPRLPGQPQLAVALAGELRVVQKKRAQMIEEMRNLCATLEASKPLQAGLAL